MHAAKKIQNNALICFIPFKLKSNNFEHHFQILSDPNCVIVVKNGATTLGITTLGITTLGITTLGITTLGITTLGIMTLDIMTFSI